jgi:hypothetical protein
VTQQAYPTSPWVADPVRFSPVTVPDLPSLNLTEAQRHLVSRLQAKSLRERFTMELNDLYYRGEQAITSLGIAIPPQLSGLRTIVGWPAIAVDPLDERLEVEGFRLAGATDADQSLWDMWTANDMPAEQSLAFVDALVMGRAWLTVGSPVESGDAPVICVESPMNMSVDYDLRAREPQAALQTYWDNGVRKAALYELNVTTHLGVDDANQWQVTGQDKHNFGSIPVIKMANRPRTHQRDGASEITPAIRDIVDAACRKLVSLEVASELYSVPQRYILGAAESDFVDSEGNPKTAWQTYITHILALTGDEEGEAPTVGQFVTYDPSVYTKVLDWYASAIAGMIGATPQDLGLYTQGNPPSADAVKFVEGRRDRKARRKQALFGGALVRAMQMAVRFDAGGDLPASMRRMEVDWMDPSTPTPGATTDALTKQIAAKMVPPTSDVVLKRAGYSGVERQRLAEDRVAVQGDEELLAITDALKGAGQKPAPAADDNQPAPAAPPQQ